MFSSGFLREFSRRRSSFSFTPQPAASASEEPEISVPRLGRERLPARAAAWCARGAPSPALSPRRAGEAGGILFGQPGLFLPQQADPAIEKEPQNVEVRHTPLQEKMSEAPQTADPLGA